MQVLPSAVTSRLRDAEAWLFDFDGTLTDYDRADAAAVDALRAVFCPEARSDDFARAARRERLAYYRLVGPGGPSGGLDAYRVAAVLRSVGLAPTPAAVDYFQEALRRETIAAPGALPLLRYLAQRHRLGVVSNAHDVEPQQGRIAATGLGGLLDVVVLAAEVGYFKPDPRILLIAAERVGAAPERCVYVGDSIEFDVAAARAAGMTAVLVGAENARGVDLRVDDLTALHRAVAGS